MTMSRNGKIARPKSGCIRVYPGMDFMNEAPKGKTERFVMLKINFEFAAAMPNNFLCRRVRPAMLVSFIR